jgi:hypothetical protein
VHFSARSAEKSLRKISVEKVSVSATPKVKSINQGESTEGVLVGFAPEIEGVGVGVQVVLCYGRSAHEPLHCQICLLVVLPRVLLFQLASNRISLRNEHLMSPANVLVPSTLWKQQPILAVPDRAYDNPVVV